MRDCHFNRRSLPPSQAGIVLIIALIALAAMTLAAVSLIRTMDTGNTILGNLAFKSDTINATDEAIEVGRSWLSGQTAATLASDGGSGTGYYSSSLSSADLFGTATIGNTTDDVDWDGSCTSCNVHARTTDLSGNPLMINGMPAAVLVARLCKNPNMTVSDPNQSCRTALVSTNQETQTGGSSSGGYAVRSNANSLAPYYKIVVRVTGPRNTFSYVEAVVL